MDWNASGADKAQAVHHVDVAGGASLLTALINDVSASPTTGLYIAAAVAIVFSTLSMVISSLRKPNLPTINAGKWGFSGQKEKKEYIANARKIIQQGFQKFGGPFYMITDSKTQIMLPPESIEAVNREAGLSFTEFTRESFLSHLETFRNFRPVTPGLFEEAVMKGLTRSLPHFTKPLSDEMTRCLDRTWGDSTEWHELSLREDVLDWVARLSARIFVGPLLSTNEEWLRISVQYTVNAFKAVQNVKLWPTFLHRVAELVDPTCKEVRADYAKATKIMKPILEERKQEIINAEREGRKPDVPDDSIEWFRNASHGREYNDTDIQIGLSIAAIHTTSDLLGQAILNLCEHPEVMEPLREEAVQVLSKYGWQKVALTEVRLMDSFLKETQRMKPIAMASMHRIATKDVELEGMKIPKGQHLAISSHRMWSPEVYGENVDEFDAARYLKRRQVPELQNNSHLVSTSKDHLGFSHGKHACPGRFFAANEVKIAMLHLVLKYDVKLADPKKSFPWIEHGVGMNTNPFAKICVRRRKEEIDFATLQ